jgi:hypothetical protein
MTFTSGRDIAGKRNICQFRGTFVRTSTTGGFELADEIGSAALALPADVRDETRMQNAFAAAVDAPGGLGVVVGAANGGWSMNRWREGSGDAARAGGRSSQLARLMRAERPIARTIPTGPAIRSRLSGTRGGLRVHATPSADLPDRLQRVQVPGEHLINHRPGIEVVEVHVVDPGA